MSNPEWDNYDHQCTICRHPLGSLPFKGDGDGSGQRFAHMSCYDLIELQRASKALIKKIDECEKHLQPIYMSAFIHGVIYSGPTYTEERDRVNNLVQFTD